MENITIKKVCGLCKHLDTDGFCHGTGYIIFKNQETCDKFVSRTWINVVK